IVLATSRDGGASWHRTRVNDDAPCANHMTPSAALDPRTGRVHVIWLENRTGKGGVAYASCEPGGERCSPNESVSDEPFASYGFVRHSPRWLSEYGSLLIDAKRSVMHAVWTQTVETPKGAMARIAYARAALR
ncbi:MAG: sialidase family protein, partial [Polyangiaceae bacterium]